MIDNFARSEFVILSCKVMAGLAIGLVAGLSCPAAQAEEDEVTPTLVEQMEMVQVVQRHMASCWRIEPGMEHSVKRVVDVHVHLNTDGTVQSAEIVDKPLMDRDPDFREAARNVRRLVTKCQPYGGLPSEHYAVWKELTLRFDPRGNY